VRHLVFNQDGSQIAYGLWNGYIVFLDNTTGQHLNVLDVYFQSTLYYLAWSQDCKKMIVQTNVHGLDVWDTSTGNKTHLDIVPDRIGGVALSPDSKVLAIGLREEGKITFWDMATFEQTGSVEIASPGDPSSLEWSPEGNHLYASIIDNVSDCAGQCTTSVGWIKAWDMNTEELLFDIDVKEAVVASLNISPDGRWLAATNGYGQLQVLDSATREIKVNLQTILLLPGFENIYSLAWLTDGERLVTNSAGGTISLWLARTGQRLEQFQLMLGEVPFNRYDLPFF
jgi:WD40 repeat protein